MSQSNQPAQRLQEQAPELGLDVPLQSEDQSENQSETRVETQPDPAPSPDQGPDQGPAQGPDQDWLQVLRREVARSSQVRVARVLRQSDGYPSSPLIGLVLSGRYAHGTRRLETLVRGIFMAQTVPCPVLGPLRLDDCLDHQSRPYSSASPLRVQMYRACRTCPQRTEEDR